MLSYNEFLVKNTVVELIDSGTIVKKQLCDLYQLPNGFKYDPLVSDIFITLNTSKIRFQVLS